jgi:nicotinamidase-related amidase
MPASALDPKTALVVSDLQKGFAALQTVHPLRHVITKAARLADAFRAARLPVVLVNVAFSPDHGDLLETRVEVGRPLPQTPDFAELVPELGLDPFDIRVTKRQPSAFYGTDLDLQLRRRRVTGIVLCGILTSLGVDSTARAASERAYNVTFVSDAITDVDSTLHELVTSKLFPRFGEVGTIDAVLALLEKHRQGA